MRKLFDKTKSVEDRVDMLELVMGRLLNRSQKTTTAIIPPHIISACKTGEDVRGDILKTMLFEGKITKGLICFARKPKNPICIEVSMLNNEVGFTKSFYLSRMREKVDLDIKTIDGSMITISAHPTVEDEKDQITEVWLSLLWTPKISNTQVQQHLIENLEKAVDQNVLEE